MSMTPRPPIPSFIPESAPFSPEQRTWLNGLFAGVFGLEGNITPLSAAEAAKLIPGLAMVLPRLLRWKPTTARRGTIRRCRCPSA
jgi:hypothetical protein